MLFFLINHTGEQTNLVKHFNLKETHTHTQTNNTNLLKYTHNKSGFLSVLEHFPFLIYCTTNVFYTNVHRRYVVGKTQYVLIQQPDSTDVIKLSTKTFYML